MIHAWWGGSCLGHARPVHGCMHLKSVIHGKMVPILNLAMYGVKNWLESGVGHGVVICEGESCVAGASNVGPSVPPP